MTIAVHTRLDKSTHLMYDPPMMQTNVKVVVTQEQAEALEALAKRNERTVSQEIRLAIRERLEREGSRDGD